MGLGSNRLDPTDNRQVGIDHSSVQVDSILTRADSWVPYLKNALNHNFLSQKLNKFKFWKIQPYRLVFSISSQSQQQPRLNSFPIWIEKPKKIRRSLVFQVLLKLKGSFTSFLSKMKKPILSGRCSSETRATNLKKKVYWSITAIAGDQQDTGGLISGLCCPKLENRIELLAPKHQKVQLSVLNCQLCLLSTDSNIAVPTSSWPCVNFYRET